jgi:DNA-binding CsgD family transcriptional regulator
MAKKAKASAGARSEASRGIKASEQLASDDVSQFATELRWFARLLTIMWCEPGPTVAETTIKGGAMTIKPRPSKPRDSAAHKRDRHHNELEALAKRWDKLQSKFAPKLAADVSRVLEQSAGVLGRSRAPEQTTLGTLIDDICDVGNRLEFGSEHVGGSRSQRKGRRGRPKTAIVAERQAQVEKLTADGLTEGKIAELLNTHPGTVNSDRKRLKKGTK